jgi:hypothetical protein
MANPATHETSAPPGGEGTLAAVPAAGVKGLAGVGMPVARCRSPGTGAAADARTEKYAEARR